MVVPVLQPESDNIPFGLALSWQRQSAACHPLSSNHTVMEEHLYELQYVLDGKGEVRVYQEVSAPESELIHISLLIGLYSQPHALLTQLCANSGVLQSIASGDSILAPMGKAWCQLGTEADACNDLAVLKLLVPGGLPNSADTTQQGNQDWSMRFHTLMQIDVCMTCSQDSACKRPTFCNACLTLCILHVSCPCCCRINRWCIQTAEPLANIPSHWQSGSSNCAKPVGGC